MSDDRRHVSTTAVASRRLLALSLLTLLVVLALAWVAPASVPVPGSETRVPAAGSLPRPSDLRPHRYAPDAFQRAITFEKRSAALASPSHVSSAPSRPAR